MDFPPLREPPFANLTRIKGRDTEDIEMRIQLKSAVLALALAGPLLAQTDSRLAEIAAKQEEKAATAQPDPPNKIERSMTWFRERDPLRKFSAGVAGFRP